MSAYSPGFSEAEVFDAAGFLDVLDGDGEAVREIIPVFLESSEATMTALSEAVRRGNAAEAAKAAHSMKGAAASIKAGALQEALLDIERAGKNEEISSLPEMLDAAEREFDRLQNVLDEWMNRA